MTSMICDCKLLVVVVMRRQGDATCAFFFFFNDTATTEIYTLSLHDALPISPVLEFDEEGNLIGHWGGPGQGYDWPDSNHRSEEHTSELQSRLHLVCRLLLEKKKLMETKIA